MVNRHAKHHHIMRTKAYARSSILLATIFLLSSCTVKYDMVTFSARGLMSPAKGTVPDVVIDTNTTAGILGGAIKSRKPYDILAIYMDTTFTIAAAEFTKVTVTYADGTVDPGIAALKLPMRLRHSLHEMPNSDSDGNVVITKSRRIEAEFPRTITRDEPFTLLIEGTFTKDNGTIVPFRIREKYNMSREDRTESWVDFVSSC